MSGNQKKIVAIDSMTLVWGMREDGPSEKVQRAKWLFDALDEDESQVIVPAVAVSEYLVPIHPDRHAGTIASISTRFLIMPFDVGCAALAAKLFKEGKNLRVMGEPNCRVTLRADCLIIATACSKGATRFYSDDADCRSLASKVIEAKELPNQPTNLFDL